MNAETGFIHFLSFSADPVFALHPLVYNELETDMDYVGMIVEVSGVIFEPGVFRTLTINSQTSGPGIVQPATGESGSSVLEFLPKCKGTLSTCM
jgi:hypothetical protein